MRFSVPPRQFTESFSSARQPRAHRADRYTENLGDAFVGHAFKTHEQNDLALLTGEAAKCAIEFDQLPPPGGIGLSRERGGYMLDVDGRPFPRLTPYRVDILMVHYRKEPSADIGP